MGRSPEHPVWPNLTPAQARDLSRTTIRSLTTYIESASDEVLLTPVVYRNSTGREFENGPLDILHHMAMHGAYHRGQLALLARSGGVEPVSTDYIAWLRGASAPTHE